MLPRNSHNTTRPPPGPYLNQLYVILFKEMTGREGNQELTMSVMTDRKEKRQKGLHKKAKCEVYNNVMERIKYIMELSDHEVVLC